MISTRYHLFTVISIFLALGIGILLGGSLGQQWLSEKQQTLMNQLELHYEGQLKKNRQLTADNKKMNQAILEEKKKIDDLLRLTIGDSLSNRFFVLISADTEQASRLRQMIGWAGGRVQVQQSLKYFPVEADGIILLGDGFRDQIDKDLLKDMQLLYRAPIVVHTAEPMRKQHLPHIYHFNGPMSGALDEYRFLKKLGHIIPSYKTGVSLAILRHS